MEALRLVHEADGYPLNWPRDPRAWLAPADAAWVTEAADGTITGHVAVREIEGRGELCRLFVIPEARRRSRSPRVRSEEEPPLREEGRLERGVSIGRALVERAKAWAAERGYSLTLNVVDEQRSAAVAFYEATGWRFTHVSDADWAGPDGQPVRLRHYEAS
ncbi:GNAT family N-acetyltransferase [Paractinoplanes hotanensis]|uniref:GNAT family N-acetyltransferase n=1 Tax=Paractinoplanes hotanensis TaxID=2906497 RepID=A0ABT0XYY5_9ACTN|nr:GNAT family N-acetyltransferase [Actinoplanes hotanensis]MCM4078927.1 GNAT family N-acetyltransferase [Actinoplanes hotanensis]